MHISAEWIQNRLVVRQTTEDGTIKEWARDLKDLKVHSMEDTGLSVDSHNQYKLFLWQPVGENILMVYAKATNVKCVLATQNGALLRLVDRVNETISASLTRSGLDIQWFGGIINRMGVEISDGKIHVGDRLSRPFDIPVASENFSRKKTDSRYLRQIHFNLSELTGHPGEVNARVNISLKINGYPCTFPVKVHSLIRENDRYRHVPVSCFYEKPYAIQLRYSSAGNLVFVCRPMEEIEYSRWFRFWESPLISGLLYRAGRFCKAHSSRKVALFYEKFCEKAEDGAFDVFEEVMKESSGSSYFLINKNAPDYDRIKNHPHVVRQYSMKYYWLLFRANAYIATETPGHMNLLRSNNTYFRKSVCDNQFIFLQHGITYMKYHGKNSPFVAGKGMEPSYIIADSDKERDVLVRMLHLPPERILKTGMAIFSKIAWKHLNQDSEDIAIIMLTWKPYEEAVSDFTQTSYYKNTLGIYQLLRRYLSPEQIRIVIHPKTKGHLENTPLASCIWTQPISQVLSIAKLLITDYSSVCYNSFYQGGGVVFFQEDLQYYEKENGKLIPADDEYIGKRVFSLEALNDILREGIVTEEGGRGRILLSSFRTEEFERRYHLINEYSDGKNIERICDALRTRGLI